MVINRVLITEWTLTKDRAGDAVLCGYGVTKGVGGATPKCGDALRQCIVSITGIAIPAHIVSAPGNAVVDSLDTMPWVEDVQRISDTLTCCRFIKLDVFKAINSLKDIQTHISEDGIMLGAPLVSRVTDSRFPIVYPTAEVANISFTDAIEGVETVGGEEYKTFEIDYKGVRLERHSPGVDLRGLYDDEALLTRGGAMRLKPANSKEYDEIPSPRREIARSWCADWCCESIGWNYSFVSRRSRTAAVFEWLYPRAGVALGRAITENLENTVVGVSCHDGTALPQCMVRIDGNGALPSVFAELQAVEFVLQERLLRWLKR